MKLHLFECTVTPIYSFCDKFVYEQYADHKIDFVFERTFSVLMNHIYLLNLFSLIDGNKKKTIEQQWFPSTTNVRSHEE